jgi:hypothetical protein
MSHVCGEASYRLTNTRILKPLEVVHARNIAIHARLRKHNHVLTNIEISSMVLQDITRYVF